MAIRTIHDKQESEDEDDAKAPSSAGYSLFAAPKDHLEGNGLMDRHEYLESWTSLFNRNLKSRGNYVRLALYVLGQYYAAKVELGEPFFMLSFIYFLYYSLSSPYKQSRDNVRSAYSVFNKGKFKNIQGDSTMEETDRLLRSGGI